MEAVGLLVQVKAEKFTISVITKQQTAIPRIYKQASA